MVFSGEKIEQYIMAKVFADSSINEGYKNAEGQGYHGAQKGGAGDIVGTPDSISNINNEYPMLNECAHAYILINYI